MVVNPYLEPGLESVLGAVEPRVGDVRHEDLRPPRARAARRRRGLRQRRAAAASSPAARVDQAFIDAHTTGWADLVAALDAQSDDDLLAQAGLTAEQVDAFVDLYGSAAGAVLIWSMGITQHRDGVDGVQAIVNLGLARGNVGRDGAGLMPIRGHSGVQGGAEMGAYATALPGRPARRRRARRRALASSGASPCPTRPGSPRPRWSRRPAPASSTCCGRSGGNFLEVLPDPPRRRAPRSPGCRCGCTRTSCSPPRCSWRATT